MEEFSGGDMKKVNMLSSVTLCMYPVNIPYVSRKYCLNINPVSNSSVPFRFAAVQN